MTDLSTLRRVRVSCILQRVVIEMPEGKYRATAEIDTIDYHYRWQFWRKPERQTLITIEVPDGIPMPPDDDALCSSTFKTDYVEFAIAEFRHTVMRRRMQYPFWQV